MNGANGVVYIKLPRQGQIEMIEGVRSDCVQGFNGYVLTPTGEVHVSGLRAGSHVLATDSQGYVVLGVVELVIVTELEEIDTSEFRLLSDRLMTTKNQPVWSDLHKSYVRSMDHPDVGGIGLGTRVGVTDREHCRMYSVLLEQSKENASRFDVLVRTSHESGCMRMGCIGHGILNPAACIGTPLYHLANSYYGNYWKMQELAWKLNLHHMGVVVINHMDGEYNYVYLCDSLTSGVMDITLTPRTSRVRAMSAMEGCMDESEQMQQKQKRRRV